MYILISLISEESMTESESRIYDTKRPWPYLAIQTWNVVLVRKPIVNAALLSTFLDV